MFYVAARGHHTDIGGLKGNSMHPDSKEWFEEGATFVSTFLVRDAVFNEEEVVKAFKEAGKYPNCSRESTRALLFEKRKPALTADCSISPN